MSKRVFDEISDEEWEQHTFNPSRIVEADNQTNPPPPIESFAFQPSGNKFENRVVINLDDDDDDEEKLAPATQRQTRVSQRQSSRNRRFVVEDDSEGDVDGEEVVEVGGVEDADEFDISWSDGEDLNDSKGAKDREELDLVGVALKKCAKISASLRQDLYGSSSSSSDQVFDRYSEVEASDVRIVTQEDISRACKSEDSNFKPLLKPYQIVGVNFLMLLNRKKIGGAILADEMGLGKTVQAATYLTLLKYWDNDPGPHLIVCPASVLENWERELKKWCPSFSVVMFHGAGRTMYSKELSSLGKAGLPPPFNVLLASYSLFERRSGQQKDDRRVLKRWQWSCVLMDEAHVLKDKNSYRWKNLMSVAKSARQRLMLTGTPLQNDLHELWSLLEFMMPDIFSTGNADLKGTLNSQGDDLIVRIKTILGPFILRRLKSDVMQQLVPKIQRVEYVFMGESQSNSYKKIIDEYRAASQCMERFSGKKSSNFTILPKNQITNYFIQFRKVANHPLLVRRMYSDEHVITIAKDLYPKGVFGFECNLERVIEELRGYNDFEIHKLLVSYSSSDADIKILEDKDVFCSAKCKALAKLLPSLKSNGHKVLIFSQWTSVLDILEWTLDLIGVSYKRLDGSTQVTERQTIVDMFNNNPSIFACLLSTRAGGQGLNLIGADTVIIHDMDFNPQMDRQAEDRCHRIGQIKPVTVYRLVTKDTVDENIYEIAKRKLVLDAAVLESCAEVDNKNNVPEKTMGEILSSLLLF